MLYGTTLIFSMRHPHSLQKRPLVPVVCIPVTGGPSVLFALCDLAVRLDAIGMIQTGGQYQHEKGRLPGLCFLRQDFLTPGAGSAVAWPRETGGQTR